MAKICIVLLALFYVTHVWSKTCDCGIACKNNKGIVTETDQCLFIAAINSLNGHQFVISDEEEEMILVNRLLNGVPSRPKLLVSTDMSYQFARFRPSCIQQNCTDTVYANDCKCELNWFETVVEKIMFVYHEHNAVFWTVIVVLFLVIFGSLLKCLCLKK